MAGLGRLIEDVAEDETGSVLETERGRLSPSRRGGRGFGMGKGSSGGVGESGKMTLREVRI